MHAARIDEGSRGYSSSEAPKEPDRSRSVADPDRFGPTFGPTGDPVEAALARALDAAAVAGRFDVVAQLAKELEARRLAREPNVVVLSRRSVEER